MLTRIKPENSGVTPLYIAAGNGHLDIVRHLVELGADKDQAQQSAAQTPLYHFSFRKAVLMPSGICWALELTKIKQRLATAESLLDLCQHQLPPNDGIVPFSFSNGHFDVGRHLVALDADKDQAENSGETPLHIAAQNGKLEVVRHLVEVVADKDQAHNEGATPLYIAAQTGHLDVVRYLVEVGADKDQALNQRRIAIVSFQLQNGHFDVVRYLLEVGANKDRAATSHR